MTSITKYKYYYFKKVLSPDFCDKVIEHCKTLQSEFAQTGKIVPNQTKGQKNRTKKIRNSTISWVRDVWITKEIDYYIHEANKKADWNFDIRDSESIQFTEYKVGQHYDWHTDSFNGPHYTGEYTGTMRKLSATVSLTDPNDYDGGYLEFDFKEGKNSQNNYKCMEILPRGSIVVFPSYTWHRVSPLTRGTRHSLVRWSSGPPFK